MGKKFFNLTFFIFCFFCFYMFHTIPVDAQNFSPNNYYRYNYPHFRHYYQNPANVDYSAINQIENNIYGQSFQNDNAYLRLNRLETRMLGTTFPQDTFSNRVNRLQLAVSNNSNVNGNGNTFQRILNFALQGLGGNGLNNNIQEDFNRQQNTNFGTGAEILH